ncbi:hypothetical protein QBC47DRAFT_396231 [Echria macrotheca]|uniref:Uncharacterized protein n=1 Tax=Echria macrotheca TaxID=438768 RepID=A0AAJ0BL64_9PEZI|nr:hypothetical protein QBC47DRAFT_396231 [Echria macrotheca]
MVYEIGWLLVWADGICEHLKWSREYDFLIPKLDSWIYHDGTDQGTRADIENYRLPLEKLEDFTHSGLYAEIDFRMKHLIYDPAGCTCSDCIQLGVVRSYHLCHTDFAINKVADPALDRPNAWHLVLTTWKCLGTVWDNTLYPHLPNEKPYQQFFRGSIHHKYENEHGDESRSIGVSSLVYRPNEVKIRRYVASVWRYKLDPPDIRC